MSQAVIDALEARLRMLDRQHQWLESMIDELNEITTPLTVRSGNRFPFRQAVEEVSDLSDDEDDDEGPFYLPPEERDYDGDASEDDQSIETILYHSDAWGFYPHGLDDGYDSDDDDCPTICMEWDDPYVSPMRAMAPIAAAYYNDD